MNLQNVDFQKISNLTPDEIIIANVLERVAKLANEATELIYNTYRFHIGEERIELIRNGQSNYEYLTYDGEWVGCFAKKEQYSIKCGKNNSEIHAYLYAKVLIEEGYVKTDEIFSENVTYGEMACIATYLCNFIERTKKLAGVEKTSRRGGTANANQNKNSQKAKTTTSAKNKAEKLEETALQVK